MSAFRAKYEAASQARRCDPLLIFNLSNVTSLFADEATLQSDIIRISDRFATDSERTYSDAGGEEIAEVRAILLRTAPNFVSEVPAWRANTVSIGRDTNVE